MDDPDNGDAVFGDGDVLTIRFDQATNKGEPHADFEQAGVYLRQDGAAFTRPHTDADFHSYPLGAAARAYDAATRTGRVGYVDRLFDFSQPLGYDYSGAWLDDSTFRVLVLRGPPVTAGLEAPGLLYSNVTARHTAGVTSANFTSRACNLTFIEDAGMLKTLLHEPATVNSTALDCALQYAGSTSPGLSGSLGVPTYPLLTRFEVDDIDNGDEVYGAGDVLVVQFHIDTNTPSCTGIGIAYVGCAVVNGSVVTSALTDKLFSFSDSIGADYSGEWATPSRFMVTILDPTGSDVVRGRTTVFVQGGIRNAAGDALSADNQTSVLFGDFGYLAEPRIDRFTVVTPANASSYTDGDTVVLHMDMATMYSTRGDEAPTSGGKGYVDHLFGFSDSLGADYSGGWRDGESAACDEGGATTLHPCFVILLLDARTGAAVSGRTIAAPSVHV